MRIVTGRGAWTYGFDVEGCRSAGATIEVTGTGTIAASNDGRRWVQAGAVDLPWGRLGEVEVDLARLLPSPFVFLRFASGGGAFAATDLAFWYNRVPAGAALPGRVLSLSGSASRGVVIPALDRIPPAYGNQACLNCWNGA